MITIPVISLLTGLTLIYLPCLLCPSFVAPSILVQSSSLVVLYSFCVKSSLLGEMIFQEFASVPAYVEYLLEEDRDTYEVSEFRTLLKNLNNSGQTLTSFQLQHILCSDWGIQKPTTRRPKQRKVDGFLHSDRPMPSEPRARDIGDCITGFSGYVGSRLTRDRRTNR